VKAARRFLRGRLAPPLLPDLLVLDGASLLAVPKDFKDVEADAHAGVPTLLVLLDRRA